MYANEKIETITREDLEKLQLERLKKTVAHAYEKSSFYKNSFDKVGVKPENIFSLADIQKLPFLTLEQINRTDIFDFLTLPLSGILRITRFVDYDSQCTKFFTREDIQNNVEMSARCLIAAGVNRTSTIGLQGDLSDGKFLDILYALESIGATAIPLGTDYKKWIKLMKKFSMDMIIGTPQLIMQLIIQLQAAEENIRDYSIKKIICINVNNIQNPLQQHISLRTGTQVYNLFAPAEVGTAGMIYQCSNDSAHHLQEDNFFAEIVQFNSKKIVEEAEHMGELVITTLNAQAMPLIRYRTGQAVKRVGEPCECGRTFLRIATPFTGIGSAE